MSDIPAPDTVPPPLALLAMGQVQQGGSVFMTPEFLGFLQALWAKYQGSGGVEEQIRLLEEAIVVLQAEIDALEGGAATGLVQNPLQIVGALLGDYLGRWSQLDVTGWVGAENVGGRLTLTIPFGHYDLLQAEPGFSLDVGAGAVLSWQ